MKNIWFWIFLGFCGVAISIVINVNDKKRYEMPPPISVPTSAPVQPTPTPAPVAAAPVVAPTPPPPAYALPIPIGKGYGEVSAIYGGMPDKTDPGSGNMCQLAWIYQAWQPGGDLPPVYVTIRFDPWNNRNASGEFKKVHFGCYGWGKNPPSTFPQATAVVPKDVLNSKPTLMMADINDDQSLMVLWSKEDISYLVGFYGGGLVQKIEYINDDGQKAIRRQLAPGCDWRHSQCFCFLFADKCIDPKDCIDYGQFAFNPDDVLFQDTFIVELKQP